MDESNGFHGASLVVEGLDALLRDFGVTVLNAGDGIDNNTTTVDGYDVLFDEHHYFHALYGVGSECLFATFSCLASVIVSYDSAGNMTMASQYDDRGWNANYSQPITSSDLYGYNEIGSFLVRETTIVPAPAAVWLFASGLMGLFSVAKREARS